MLDNDKYDDLSEMMTQIINNVTEFISSWVEDSDEDIYSCESMLQALYLSFVYLHFYYSHIVFNINKGVKREQVSSVLIELTETIAGKAVTKAQKYVDVYESRRDALVN